MLAIALELAQRASRYEDVATKFFEHFMYIAGAINNIGSQGVSLWNEEDELLLRRSPPAEQRVDRRSRSAPWSG